MTSYFPANRLRFQSSSPCGLRATDGSGKTYIFARLPFSDFGLNQFRRGET
jgi:hypothetical protein